MTFEDQKASCERKVCYGKKDAQTILNRLMSSPRKQRNDKLRIYQCRNCNFWHITHKEDWNKNKRKR